MRRTLSHVQFEKRAMDMLLAGDDLVLGELRSQYANSAVESRKFTGAGFFTHFKIGEGVQPITGRDNLEIGDVSVSLDGVKDAIGVILFVRNGYLSFIEGYTLVSDVWPDEYSNVVLEYMSIGGKRDLEEMRISWLTRLQSPEKN